MTYNKHLSGSAIMRKFTEKRALCEKRREVIMKEYLKIIMIFLGLVVFATLGTSEVVEERRPKDNISKVDKKGKATSSRKGSESKSLKDYYAEEEKSEDSIIYIFS